MALSHHGCLAEALRPIRHRQRRLSDLVEGLLRAMFYPNTRGEIVNLGNPAEITVAEVARRAKALTKSRSIILHQAARPEEIARRKPDITKAQRLLEWRPTVGLDEGIQKTAQWLNGKLAERRSIQSHPSN